MSARTAIRLLAALMLAVGVSMTAAVAQMDHAQHDADDHSVHGMTLDLEGMVMNHNPGRLPQDCAAISGDLNLEVRVGTKHARRGFTYGYSQHEWRVEPCSRVNVTFINEDQVRHQWMVHGLPKYLYPQGMFHLEVNGGFRKTAAFIVPSGSATLLVHCDLSHHMEQGLKGQILVGGGGANIPGIPGLFAPRFPDVYE